MDIRVTYCFGSKREVLDGSTIVQWLDTDHKGDVTIDRSKVEEYVRELSVKFNTAYCTKKLETSYGQVVSITKGHYGWMIDKKSEIEALIGIIQSGASQEREPVYLQTAASHDGPDFGNTYVEMNLTSQHMFFYKEGKLLIESDFVSGDEAKGFRTPAGAYEITYKQMNATLKGKDYKTPIKYWMPFNGNIGMHDGYWRTSFGPVLCYYPEGAAMPRMSKKRKEEWAFLLNDRNRITYNPLCRKCRRPCKQSFRAIIIDCPPFISKRARMELENGR